MKSKLRRSSFHSGGALFFGLFAGYLTCESVFAVDGGTMSAGGGEASSSNYSISACMGDTAAGRSSGGAVSNSSGAPDIQPSGVKTISLHGTPFLALAQGTAQLSGSAVMEDDSVTLLDGPEVSWSPVSGPVVSISSSGVATMDQETQDSKAVVNGSWMGVSGNVEIYVLNGNYGTYGSADIPDVWQVTYFGLNNPNAAPLADPKGTGQNNLFKYIAGLDPTNSSSRFNVTMPTNAIPSEKKVTFSPWFGDRTYVLSYSDNLTAGSWVRLPGVFPVVSGNTGTLTDPAPSSTRRFYRVEISKP